MRNAPAPSDPLRPPDRHARRYRALSRLLDDAVRVPGTDFRVGLDGLMGLLPGAGDVLGSALGLYGLSAAASAGAPRSLLVRMAGNLAVDALVGAVPVLGDVFDFVFKAHRRNARLLEAWSADPPGQARASRWTVAALVAGVSAVLVAALVGGALLMAALARAVF